MVKIEPHDLLQIGSINDLSDKKLPQWATDVFPKSLTVVVRRSPIISGEIPVGIRGPKREQRFGSYLEITKVHKVTTPYELARMEKWNELTSERQKLPAVKALPQINMILQGYHWGIGGSVGFELATKTITAKETSDLDLIWKPMTPITKSNAKELLHSLNQFDVHVDLQVIQENDGFSLEEYANSSSSVMIKTLGDPILVKDPWIKR
ncbi:malonate decarboxylase holo-ACP synthase [Companilactobacillus sp. FL22-1]|uniref:malonate decarboxylase holo-ACP synthase n=1 Tax=Companilactobacillus sp. FL22-1 TaxID=3373892 RepID=UPI003754EE66